MKRRIKKIIQIYYGTPYGDVYQVERYGKFDFTIKYILIIILLSIIPIAGWIMLWVWIKDLKPSQKSWRYEHEFGTLAKARNYLKHGNKEESVVVEKIVK